jgi:ribosomal protein S27E
MTTADGTPEPIDPLTLVEPAEPPGPAVNATPAGAGDGVIRCPKCGASDVTFNAAKGVLMCEFCRNEWAEQRLDDAMGLSAGIGELRGITLSSAAVDITDTEALVTLKCTGCGSEVVINTDTNLQARCHWCKHVLSLNNRIPNGAVPDGILPFSVPKEQAMASIAAFVQKRKAFAHPDFAATFKAENVMGVYMPYMTVDGNVSARLEGIGEIHRGTVQVSKERREYKADRYAVTRQLDMHIDDLIVETSSDKANIHSTTSTTNIINAVLPYDVKEIVRFNSHFLGEEYTSERRDMDVDAADDYAAGHFLTMARGAVNGSIAQYDRGVRWEAEQVSIKGTRWTSVLLPVWLYGFTEQTKKGPVTHYIAVNGRSGYTMGSVPINMRKARAWAWGVAIVVSLATWPIGIAILVMS